MLLVLQICVSAPKKFNELATSFVRSTSVAKSLHGVVTHFVCHEVKGLGLRNATYFLDKLFPEIFLALWLFEKWYFRCVVEPAELFAISFGFDLHLTAASSFAVLNIAVHESVGKKCGVFFCLVEIGSWI
jgi:hypothetical protein